MSMPRAERRLRAWLRAGLSDVRGVAAVEFALLLPILIAFYFGAVELTQGMMAQERTIHTAATIGDLVSQSSTLTSADITDILSVGQTTMYPYPTGSLGERVTSVSEDAKGKITVTWSQASGGMTALTKGSGFSDPNLTKVLTTNDSEIVAESQYTYTSAFNYVLPKPITFNEKSYSKPRISTSVTCSDC
jgi:Flp pilus assembly protein TadG